MGQTLKYQAQAVFKFHW